MWGRQIDNIKCFHIASVSSAVSAIPDTSGRGGTSFLRFVCRCALWSHRAVTGVCGGKRCLFVWAGRVGRRHVIALCI